MKKRWTIRDVDSETIKRFKKKALSKDIKLADLLEEASKAI